MHSLVVNQLKPMIASIFSNLRETLLDGQDLNGEVIPLIKPYEDVSAGFGKAIMRGSEKFAASTVSTTRRSPRSRSRCRTSASCRTS